MPTKLRSVPPTLHAGLVIVRLSDIKYRPMQWLWPGRIPIGELSLIAGVQGLGKTYVCTDIAARNSRGWGWPDAPNEKRPPISTLFFSLEDPLESTVKERAEAAGADENRLFYVNGVRRSHGDLNVNGFDLRADVSFLEETLDANREIQHVIIDPTGEYLPGVDDNQNGPVQEALTPLRQLARARHVAITIVHHVNKALSLPGIFRVAGARAFTTIPRVSFMIVQDKHNVGRRFLTPIKVNAGAEPPTLAFTPGEEGIQWEAMPVPTSVAHGLANPNETRRNKVMMAKEFLRTRLSDGSVSLEQLHLEIAELDISIRTLERAKKELGVGHIFKPAVDNKTTSFWYLNGNENRGGNGVPRRRVKTP